MWRTSPKRALNNTVLLSQDCWLFLSTRPRVFHFWWPCLKVISKESPAQRRAKPCTPTINNELISSKTEPLSDFPGLLEAEHYHPNLSFPAAESPSSSLERLPRCRGFQCIPCSQISHCWGLRHVLYPVTGQRPEPWFERHPSASVARRIGLVTLPTVNIELEIKQLWTRYFDKNSGLEYSQPSAGIPAFWDSALRPWVAASTRNNQRILKLKGDLLYLCRDHRLNSHSTTLCDYPLTLKRPSLVSFASFYFIKCRKMAEWQIETSVRCGPLQPSSRRTPNHAPQFSGTNLSSEALIGSHPSASRFGVIQRSLRMSVHYNIPIPCIIGTKHIAHATRKKRHVQGNVNAWTEVIRSFIGIGRSLGSRVRLGTFKDQLSKSQVMWRRRKRKRWGRESWLFKRHFVFVWCVLVHCLMQRSFGAGMPCTLDANHVLNEHNPSWRINASKTITTTITTKYNTTLQCFLITAITTPLNGCPLRPYLFQLIELALGLRQVQKKREREINIRLHWNE